MTKTIKTITYPIRHPINTTLVVALAFFVTLQFSPETQRHFNKVLQYGGLATVSFIAADAAKTTIAKLKADKVDSKVKMKKGMGKITAGSNRFVQKIVAAEVTGWVPIIGDVAGVAFTVAAFVEMCATFKAAEQDYGVPIYTGTSCESAANAWNKISTHNIVTI